MPTPREIIRAFCLAIRTGQLANAAKIVGLSIGVAFMACIVKPAHWLFFRFINRPLTLLVVRGGTVSGPTAAGSRYGTLAALRDALIVRDWKLARELIVCWQRVQRARLRYWWVEATARIPVWSQRLQFWGVLCVLNLRRMIAHATIRRPTSACGARNVTVATSTQSRLAKCTETESAAGESVGIAGAE